MKNFGSESTIFAAGKVGTEVERVKVLRVSEGVCFLYGVEMAIKICNALVGNDTYSADLSPPNMEKCFSILSSSCLSHLCF